MNRIILKYEDYFKTPGLFWLKFKHLEIPKAGCGMADFGKAKASFGMALAIY